MLSNILQMVRNDKISTVDPHTPNSLSAPYSGDPAMKRFALDTIPHKSRNGSITTPDTPLWEIDTQRLIIRGKIGTGAFSNVFEAHLKGDAPSNSLRRVRFAFEMFADCGVAVKMLPEYSDFAAKSDFLEEIRVNTLFTIYFIFTFTNRY
jgi:hypothetical protein